MSITEVDLSFTQAKAEEILSFIPVDYLRNKPLRGRLFAAGETSEVVSLVDSSFFVDHEEPSRAQKEFEETHKMGWPLGKLVEGHEFLMVLKV
jgi:hypothetical protein